MSGGTPSPLPSLASHDKGLAEKGAISRSAERPQGPIGDHGVAGEQPQGDFPILPQERIKAEKIAALVSLVE
jgi:hypothetical protein